jgi:rubrerythrin
MNGYRSKRQEYIGSTRGRPAFYRMECALCGHVWNFQDTEDETCPVCHYTGNESPRYRWGEVEEYGV